VGEHSLIDTNNMHTYSVRVCAPGASFLCIDRATFWHFADLGRVGAAEIPAQIAAALRVACCQRILEMPPPDRSDSEIRLLVAFLHGLQVHSDTCNFIAAAADQVCKRDCLQAFADLTEPMMRKVCKGMTIEQFTANQVICEEDEPGDSMYIVLSGQCVVRAQAPPVKAVAAMDFAPQEGLVAPAASISKSTRRVKVAAAEQVPQLATKNALQCLRW
jgi:hypothetical protein